MPLSPPVLLVVTGSLDGGTFILLDVVSLAKLSLGSRLVLFNGELEFA